MKHFSNKYIFVFSIIMVLSVATLLSLAATLLQPAQQKNLEIEKKRSMLESIRIAADRSTTEDLYDKYITESFVLDNKGNIIPGTDAFKIEMNAELRKPAEEQNLPVFRASLDNGEKVIILPVEGKGLWGPIYGNVSLESDMNTIYGVNFDHKSETPGLGAEINTSSFESEFQGKQLYERDEFVSVKVIKGGAEGDDPHGVDAISGGTVTSKGLEKMLFDCIGRYNDFLIKNRN